MLERIHIRNFKSLRDIDFEAKKLNILTGLNGSGKSSLLQSLLFFKQAAKNIFANRCFQLNGDYVTFGTQRDIFYCYNQKSEDITFEITTKEKGFLKYSFPFSSEDSDVIECQDFYNLFQGANTDTNKFTKLLNHLTSFGDIKYLSAERLSPQQEYPFQTSKIGIQNWNKKGEDSIAYLAEYNTEAKVINPSLLFPDEKDFSLQAQVNAWMQKISPTTNIHADRMTNINKAILAVSFAIGINQYKFKPQNVGFGIPYVLPIIIMILTAQPGDCLIIENPEAHIHPRGQAELGRLLALCAQSGVQLFVETHSDHIINGVRVAVKKKQIDRHNVAISFFNRVSTDSSAPIYEQYSVCDTINIDDNGELSSYPEGFLDEWNNQLLELL